jgi:hypothetical protein
LITLLVFVAAAAVIVPASRLRVIATDAGYRLRRAIGSRGAEAGPLVFVTNEDTWTVACLLSPVTSPLEPAFLIELANDGGSLEIPAALARRGGSLGLFTATFRRSDFREGTAVAERLRIHVRMRTNETGISCPRRSLELPLAGCNSLRATIFSDSQSGAPAFRTLLTAAAALDAAAPSDILVHLGDTTQADDDEREVFAYFLAPIEAYLASRRKAGAAADIPIILVRANHDHLWSLALMGGGTPLPVAVESRNPAGGMQQQLGATDDASGAVYFSTVTGPIRWIVLDAISSRIQEQVEWLRSLCTATAGPASSMPGSHSSSAGNDDAACLRLWTIVLVHIPPFIEYWDPVAWHNGSESEWGAHVRTAFLPALLDGHCQVDAILGGHSHIYQRGDLRLLRPSPSSKPVLLAVLGGAGGALEDTRSGHVADYGVYRVSSAQHHFVSLSASENVASATASDGSECRRDARGHGGYSDSRDQSLCRGPLEWSARSSDGSSFDRFILRPDPPA